MTEKFEMVVVGNARYRYEDARRLGLVADGKVITARSVERPPSVVVAPGHVVEDSGAVTPENSVEDEPAEAKTPQDDAQDAENVRPSRNSAKAKWKAYALSQGLTEDDLDGLTRDQISEMFPDDVSDVEDNE